jgi:predicted deacylase
LAVLVLAARLATGCGGGSTSRTPTQTGGTGPGSAIASGGTTATGGVVTGTGGVTSAGGAVVDAAIDGHRDTGETPGSGGYQGTVDTPALDAGGELAPLALDAAPTDTEDTSCALPDTIATTRLPTLAFTSYHSLAAITTYLAAVEAAVPEVAKLVVLGKSKQGRDIPYLLINATCQEAPPAVLLVGTHHGDEGSSTEATLAHVDLLLRGDASVRKLLRGHAFYVMPVLNADGHEANPPRRENADGVDLNRDYAYPERDETSSFKEKETQLIKALQDQVGFQAALAFHSGSTSVLWPWCYTTTPSADDARLSSLGAKTAQAMGFSTYSASAFDYVTQGEYIDYAYLKTKTLAFTVEVSLEKTPSVAALPQVVATTWTGTLAFVQGLQGLQDLQANHSPAVAVPSQMLMHAPRRGNQRLE